MKYVAWYFEMEDMYKMVMVASHPVEQLIVQHICERDQLFSEVEYLKNGEQLLNSLTINENNFTQPDIILLDMNNSECNGWDFLEQLQKLYTKFTKAIDVYILSSLLTDVDQYRSLEYPFVKGFYLKPMTSLLMRQLSQNYGSVA